MGKQHRPPGHTQAPSVGARHDQVEDAAEVSSNAELQSEHVADADLDLVREIAAPLVERALLALALPARPPAQVDRFVEVVERSALPAERQHELVGKLRADQAADTAVRAAVARHLGDASARESATRLLDAVHRDLTHGGGQEHAWVVGDHRVELSAAVREGQVGARADALVRELADARGADVGLGGSGPSTLALCRTLQHLLFEEEDEEEDELAYAGPAEG